MLPELQMLTPVSLLTGEPWNTGLTGVRKAPNVSGSVPKLPRCIARKAPRSFPESRSFQKR